MRRRAHGPYERANKWRIVTVDPDGTRHTVSFDTAADATAAREALEQEYVAEDGTGALLAGIQTMAIRLPSWPTWIYFLHDSSGAVIYVGASGSIRNRIDEHRGNGVDFAYATWSPTVYEREHAFNVESMLVRRLTPRLNVLLQDPERKQIEEAVFPLDEMETHE